MKLIEKLTLSARTGYISVFDEGLFLRLYNQSAYIINELQQQNLTLSCNIIKYLQNKPIVYCAFPQKNLYNRLGGAVKTPWGYEIAGDFDISGYEHWFKWAFAHALERTKKRNEVKLHCSIYSRPSHTANILSTVNAHNQSTLLSPQTLLNQSEKDNHLERVYLNQKQIAFLKSWQQGIYPLEVTEGFIESLKRQLIEPL